MISFLLIIISFGMMFLSDILKLSERRGPDTNIFIAGMTALAASGISVAMSGSRFPVLHRACRWFHSSWQFTSMSRRNLLSD
jgi:hypothetical protein